MTQQQQLIKSFAYLTQYDRCGMFDNDIINTLQEATSNINDRDLLIEILDNASYVDDTYNNILYDLLISGSINNDNIDDLASVWEELANHDIIEAMQLCDVDMCDMLPYSDYIIGYVDDLYNEADADLKENGINASALYWYDELLRYHNNEVIAIDCYNRSYAYNSYNDLALDLVDTQDIENAIFNKFRKEN